MVTLPVLEGYRDDDGLKLEIYPKAEIKKYLPSAIVYKDQYTNQILRADYGCDSHLQYMPSINLLVLKYDVRKYWATNVYNTGDQFFLRYSKVTLYSINHLCCDSTI